MLINSQAAWASLLRLYEAEFPSSSFIDFFWTWRALFSGLYSVILPDLPKAKVYHSLCTGYAGLYLARAKIESGRPVILSEHGIYTNERRIEIASADWLHKSRERDLSIIKKHRDLKDMWLDTFVSYSHVCYQACDSIITLYQSNQQFQIEDGAPPDRLAVIPNGIDYLRFSAIARVPDERPPTVAMIGRVVPIKDVKNFIRACGFVCQRLAEFEALIMGPTDEDEEYYQECQDLVARLELRQTVRFTGRVKLDEYLGRIDVNVLTSVSEAQPLVVLEAGAAGVPTVATDVGACREMILGHDDEDPHLGPGGAITPVSNPLAVAEALTTLLTDPAWYRRCSNAIRTRVERSYHKRDQDAAYRKLYLEYRALPDATPGED